MFNREAFPCLPQKREELEKIPVYFCSGFFLAECLPLCPAEYITTLPALECLPLCLRHLPTRGEKEKKRATNFDWQNVRLFRPLSCLSGDFFGLRSIYNSLVFGVSTPLSCGHLPSRGEKEKSALNNICQSLNN